MADSNTQTALTHSEEEYNPARAKELCDLYSSGMLCESHYSEMLVMVRTAYNRRWQVLDSLIAVCNTPEAFAEARQNALVALNAQHQYAEFLANICNEAKPEQLGEDNAKAFEQLKQEMQASYKRVTDRENQKFNK
ncbi:MAG: hypothetical protein NC402_07200 [Prevotella sp.]|nr:hypothetical protein [Prevotella sp.]MCM1074337.1 hypothetical protein [Ruminococcus sp.]